MLSPGHNPHTVPSQNISHNHNAWPTAQSEDCSGHGHNIVPWPQPQYCALATTSTAYHSHNPMLSISHSPNTVCYRQSLIQSQNIVASLDTVRKLQLQHSTLATVLILSIATVSILPSNHSLNVLPLPHPNTVTWSQSQYCPLSTATLFFVGDRPDFIT